MSEKNLPPSHQRLEQARERGQIGVSQDLVKVAKYAVIAEMAFACEPSFRLAVADVIDAARIAVFSAGVSSPSVPLSQRLSPVFAAVMPLLWLSVLLAGAAGLVAWGATLMQTGFNVAPKAFEQGAQKLNPISNLKQIFSSQKALMLVLGPIKIGAVMAVVAHQTVAIIPALMQADRLSAEVVWHVSLMLLQQIERQSLLVLVVLALSDVVLQRWQTYRSLRMDIQELKQDHKSSEGDPHVKGHRKSTSKQMLSEPPRVKLPKPSAVVVNPEHIAVALAYDFNSRQLPRIVAKGRDQLAQSIRTWAIKERVPIIRYVTLARQLESTGEVGERVPGDALKAVALLYRAVRDMQEDGGSIDQGGLYEIDEDMAREALDQT